VGIRFFTACLAIFAISVLFSCGGGGKSSNPDVEPDWRVGTASDYVVSGAGATTVQDSLTGIEFEFPQGGYGTLTLAEIEAGPEAPYDGEGFTLEYTGTEKIYARIPTDDAYCVLLMGYGGSYGSRDDRDEDDWRALPQVESDGNEVVFELIPQEGSSGISSGAASPVAHNGFKHHWLAKIPSGSSDAVKLAAIKSQATEFIDHYIDSLPASIKTHANTEYTGRLAPTFYADDNYYIGFTRRRLIGNSTTPMIGIMPNADDNTIAHEVGHYMHHVLIGDAAYLQIEDSAPDNHGVGDLHDKRLSITEDMAYFGQYYLLGHVNAVDPIEPGLLMRGKDPDLLDYPSLEGFGCALLARLNSTNNKIRDMEFTSDQRDFPVVGASFSDIFGIIAKGAVNIDQLREHIKEYLVSKGQRDKYPVILERLGWRYNARAKILNPDGDPLLGASVKCVAKVGSTEYFTRTEYGSTDDSGETSYIEIFPDSSYLRVEYNGKTYDLPIYADPTQSTNVPVELGELEIDPFDLSRFNVFSIDCIARGKMVLHSSYSPDQEYWVDFDLDIGYLIEGSFTGNTFTAEWDTAIYANPVNCTGNVSITIDPQGKRLISATADFIEPASINATKREYEISIGSISSPERWDENQIYFNIEGESACQFINDLWYRTYNEAGLNWFELIDHECNSESIVRVALGAY